jgi:hypothetical protein
LYYSYIHIFGKTDDKSPGTVPMFFFLRCIFNIFFVPVFCVLNFFLPQGVLILVQMVQLQLSSRQFPSKGEHPPVQPWPTVPVPRELWIALPRLEQAQVPWVAVPRLDQVPSLRQSWAVVPISTQKSVPVQIQTKALEQSWIAVPDTEHQRQHQEEHTTLQEQRGVTAPQRPLIVEQYSQVNKVTPFPEEQAAQQTGDRSRVNNSAGDHLKHESDRALVTEKREDRGIARDDKESSRTAADLGKRQAVPTAFEGSGNQTDIFDTQPKPAIVASGSQTFTAAGSSSSKSDETQIQSSRVDFVPPVKNQASVRSADENQASIRLANNISQDIADRRKDVEDTSPPSPQQSPHSRTAVRDAVEISGTILSSETGDTTTTPRDGDRTHCCCN